ncbi:MAG: DNA gyrase inhibitor YacG [Planctomycetes bacterium]|nr:DNA gyrase inhibitor YacG [Planctomycetota bacterium]
MPTRSQKCPECKKRFSHTTEGKWLPFCSERCKLLDLGRWLNNEYAIVEDLKRGHDLKSLKDIDDPDVKRALEELDD